MLSILRATIFLKFITLKAFRKENNHSFSLFDYALSVCVCNANLKAKLDNHGLSL